MKIDFVSHLDEVVAATDKAVIRALTACGMQAVNYADKLSPVDTGKLRQSIKYEVDPPKSCVYVGSALKYAPYVELGTGKYYPGGGRPTPWLYKDAKGEWHLTHGQKPQPFIKPAIADHKSDYKKIIEKYLKGAD